MNKLTKIIIVILVALCLILSYFIYTQIPKSTYKLRHQPKLLTSEIVQGGELVWQNDICKLHDRDYRTERVLRNLDSKREFAIDTTNNRSSSNATSLKKGECRISEISQSIPINQQPGEYQLIIRIFVKSNKYSIDKFEYTVGPFTIK